MVGIYRSNKDSLDAIITSQNIIRQEVAAVAMGNDCPELWGGKLAVQTATDWFELDSLTSFEATSGAAAYGTEIQIFGSGDQSIFTDCVEFSLNDLTLVDASNSTPFYLRFSYSTVNFADAIARGQYTTLLVLIDNLFPQRSGTAVIPVGMPRQILGTKVWAQTKNQTNNATVSFYVGVRGFSDNN